MRPKKLLQNFLFLIYLPKALNFLCSLSQEPLKHSTCHLFRLMYLATLGFPGGSVIKNPPASAGDLSQIPGLGRFPGEENGNPFQYSCRENSMDKEAWWATVHGVTKESDMIQQLSNNIIQFFGSHFSKFSDENSIYLLRN